MVDGIYCICDFMTRSLNSINRKSSEGTRSIVRVVKVIDIHSYSSEGTRSTVTVVQVLDPP